MDTSDLMTEKVAYLQKYHGGCLFTYNGVPKSGYEALRLLLRTARQLLHTASVTAGISPKANGNGRQSDSI